MAKKKIPPPPPQPPRKPPHQKNPPQTNKKPQTTPTPQRTKPPPPPPPTTKPPTKNPPPPPPPPQPPNKTPPKITPPKKTQEERIGLRGEGGKGGNQPFLVRYGLLLTFSRLNGKRRKKKTTGFNAKSRFFREEGCRNKKKRTKKIGRSRAVREKLAGPKKGHRHFEITEKKAQKIENNTIKCKETTGGLTSSSQTKTKTSGVKVYRVHWREHMETYCQRGKEDNLRKCNAEGNA